MTQLERTLDDMAAYSILDDTDLLALIASYAYCYAVYRPSLPKDFVLAMDVAYNRGLLNPNL